MSPADRRPKVLIAAPLPARFLQPLSDGAVEVVEATPGSQPFDAAIGDIDGLLIPGGLEVRRALLERAPRLRVISTISVGLDHIDMDEVRRRGIAVATTPVLADAVAELTMGLLLAVSRRLVVADRCVTTGSWADAPFGTDLKGKELLVVGFGAIGREVARRAEAFKMGISYFDTRADLADAGAARRVGSLAEGLATADVVSLHVDLNPSTHHLIDAAALSHMKPTALLINTARGKVVDQVALTAALVAGRIAGAGLDVLEIEPPPPDEPILGLDNVVVLPHIGSATHETRTAMIETGVDNLRRCVFGEPCGNLV